MSSVLKVDNIEKYYGSKANLTKASIVSVLKWKRGSILELWGLPEVGRRHY